MVDNVIISDHLARGFRGGPRFFTDILTTMNGQERRFKNRSIAIHDYTYGFENRSRSEVLEMKSFFMDRNGRFKPWLLKDWGDFQATDEIIGTGNGVTTAFQLLKTYTAGFNPYPRTIRHAKSGAVIKVAGVTQDGTSSPPAYTISATGLVTFASAPAIGSVTWTGEFYVPVRFDTDYFPITSEYQAQMDIMTVTDLNAIEVVP